MFYLLSPAMLGKLLNIVICNEELKEKLLTVNILQKNSRFLIIHFPCCLYRKLHFRFVNLKKFGLKWTFRCMPTFPNIQHNCFFNIFQINWYACANVVEILIKRVS